MGEKMSQEEKVARMLGIKTGKKGEEVKAKFDLSNMWIGKVWYFEHWFEKIVLTLSFFALLWTLFKLVFMGEW